MKMSVLLYVVYVL